MVEVEHSAEPRPADDLAAPPSLVGRLLDQLSVQRLMEPFPTVVRHELLDDVPQVPFPEEYEMAQALVSGRLDKSLRVRVRTSHRLHVMGTARLLPFG
jgi:hypothetical protein